MDPATLRAFATNPNLHGELRDTLRALVEQYYSVEGDLRRLRAEGVTLRRRKRDLSVQLTGIMSTLGADFRFNGDILHYTVRKVALPPSRAIIKERLQSLLYPDDPERQEGALQMVMAPRSVEERASIRKIRVR